MKDILRSVLLASVCALGALAVPACSGGEAVIDCADLCTELNSCFEENFDMTQCVDSCEDQSEAAIDDCDLCLDENERECTACTAECASFIRLD